VQTVGDGYLDSLQGSVAPELKVDAWYDGEIVYEGLNITSASVTQDGSRTIVSTASVVATDTDGQIIPSKWSDPLAPFGSELHIRQGIRTGGQGVEWVSLGWYRIEESDPDETWAAYYNRTHLSQEPQWVPRGVDVTVQAVDRMARLDDARFLAPESPLSLASVQAEIVRLARDHVPIANLSGFSDAPIPASVAYQTSRVQALQDLASVLDKVVRINPNGALTLAPRSPSGNAVWTVEIGRTGTITGFNRKLTRSQLYNGVISAGTTEEGVAVQAVETEPDGPLRWAGPFGQVPYGHSSPLINTEEAAQSDALTRLNRLIRERVVPITVSCITNPALEIDDIVALKLPDASLSGPVASISRDLTAAVMAMTVMVPRSQLWG
jgi:hypothetical protein